MKTYHKAAKNLTGKQKDMYFRLGAEMMAHRSAKIETETYNDAMWALATTNWKGLKGARALLMVTDLYPKY